jgi:hypothetical protein
VHIEELDGEKLETTQSFGGEENMQVCSDLCLCINKMKSTFLDGELDEEIYVDQPNGFIVRGQEGKECKLLMSLSGFKQAPKEVT